MKILFNFRWSASSSSPLFAQDHFNTTQPFSSSKSADQISCLDTAASADQFSCSKADGTTVSNRLPYTKTVPNVFPNSRGRTDHFRYSDHGLHHNAAQPETVCTPGRSSSHMNNNQILMCNIGSGSGTKTSCCNSLSSNSCSSLQSNSCNSLHSSSMLSSCCTSLQSSNCGSLQNRSCSSLQSSSCLTVSPGSLVSCFSFYHEEGPEEEFFSDIRLESDLYSDLAGLDTFTASLTALDHQHQPSLVYPLSSTN
jgi:hypothetical protein